MNGNCRKNVSCHRNRSCPNGNCWRMSASCFRSMKNCCGKKNCCHRNRTNCFLKKTNFRKNGRYCYRNSWWRNLKNFLPKNLIRNF